MTVTGQRRGLGGSREFRGLGAAVRAACAWACCLLGSAVAGEGWLTDYDAAMAAAREHQKPVLTIFTGSDWCPHCRTLEEKVLETETFRDWAEGRIVLLMIDLPQQGISAEERAARSRVCIKYGVRTFPNAVLIGPDGGRIASQAGYLGQSADAWVAALDSHLPAPEPTATPVVAALEGQPLKLTSGSGRPRR